MNTSPADDDPNVLGMLAAQPWYDSSDFRRSLLPMLATGLTAAAARAFVEANRANQQGRNLLGLSMSGLGGCARRAAYGVAQEPATDLHLATDDEARAALLGTWIHAGYLPFLAGVLEGSRYEMPVVLTVPAERTVLEVVPRPEWGATYTIKGTTDMWVPAMGGGVLDLKTLGAFKLGQIQAKGSYENHRTQVRGYATACVQAGIPVRWVGWLYMERDTGEVFLAIEEFTDQAVVDTYERVRYLASLAEEPDYAPATMAGGRALRGPIAYSPCNSCPWLQRCWGPGTKPGEPDSLEVADDPEREFFAAKAVELKETISDLKKELEFYEGRVGRPKAQLYGSFSITYGKEQERLDTKEARRLLEEHGIPVPTTLTKPSQFIRRAKTKESNQ